MMRCPMCNHVSYIRTNRYITDQTKEAYYQFTNLDCSCAFKTIESISKVINRKGQN